MVALTLLLTKSQKKSTRHITTEALARSFDFLRKTFIKTAA
jgi:hypothetical protein